MRISETVPDGDIYVESDGSLEIMCVVYGNTAYGDMKFISDKHDVSSYVRQKKTFCLKILLQPPFF